MTPEEIKQVITEAISKNEIYKLLIQSVIPVILTIIFNVIYDVFRRKGEAKLELSLKRLTNLYLPLYTIVSQSEYIRYFFNISLPFHEVPFNEIHKKCTKINILSGGVEEKEKEDEITSFNKKKMVKLIIDNSQYASAKLIKLAVAHRYLEDNYLTDISNKEISEKFADEEVKVLSEVVLTIVKETNELLMYCGMEYDINELELGVMNTSVYKE